VPQEESNATPQCCAGSDLPLCYNLVHVCLDISTFDNVSVLHNVGQKIALHGIELDTFL
jgi:hypothetical protein